MTTAIKPPEILESSDHKTEVVEKDGATLFFSGDRKLGYSHELGELINTHQELLTHIFSCVNTFEDAILKGEDPGILEEDGVTLKWMSNAHGRNRYQMTVSVPDIQGERVEYTFFVKTGSSEQIENDESNGNGVQKNESGFEEFLTMKEVEKALSPYEWAKAVSSELGYEDSDKTLSMAKWNDGLTKTVSDLKKELKERGQNEKNSELFKDVEDKRKIVEGVLTAAGFTDISEINMAYNEGTGELMVFDIRLATGNHFDEKGSLVTQDFWA